MTAGDLTQGGPITDTPANNPLPLQGEGDHIGARKFDQEQAAFAKSGQVEPKAREAKDALDGPEGKDLEAARQAAARGESLNPPKR